MGKLIDAEVIVNFLEEEKNNWEGQNPYNRGRSDSLQWIIDRIKSNNSRIGIIDSTPSPTIKPGDKKEKFFRGYNPQFRFGEGERNEKV